MYPPIIGALPERMTTALKKIGDDVEADQVKKPRR